MNLTLFNYNDTAFINKRYFYLHFRMYEFYSVKKL